MSHGMGGMSMGDGVPSLFYFQKMYWVVVGISVGWATCVNVYNNMLYRQRFVVHLRSTKSDRLMIAGCPPPAAGDRSLQSPELLCLRL